MSNRKINKLNASEITPGRFIRFDGAEVKVLAVARHTEADYRLVVWSLATHPEEWQASPEGVFKESVISGGRSVQRFRRIDEEVKESSPTQ